MIECLVIMLISTKEPPYPAIDPVCFQTIDQCRDLRNAELHRRIMIGEDVYITCSEYRNGS